MKSVLKAIAAILILLVLVVAGYVAYVFIAYYRVPDMQKLAPVRNSAYIPDEQSASVGKEYKIVTWNIGFGAYSDDYSFFMDGGKYSRAFSKEAVISNVNAMVGYIASVSPDFAFIQEVDTDSTRSYHVDESELVNYALSAYSSVFAQNYDSPYLFYPIFSPHGKSVSGILTESKIPIESSLRRSLPIEKGVMKLVDLDRCYSVTRIPVENGKTLCLYNTHLSAYTSDGTIATEQLKMLVADMESEYDKGNYVICGGDFNKDLLGNSSEVFGVEMGEVTWAQPIPDGVIPSRLSLVACSNAPSCRNADRPFDETDFVLTIDGFLVSGNVEVLKAEVVDLKFKCSDHNPGAMSFRLK